MHISVRSLVFVILVTEGLCSGIKSWDMNLFCGTDYKNIKTVRDNAGEIYFDVADFSGRIGKCNLTVSPAMWNDIGGNMVMFYFTTFEFESGCDLLNVTVMDGEDGSAGTVKGLPRFICGVNSSLTYYVFSTTGRSLQLQVHVNLQKQWKMYRGHFNLKFITYHTGSCHEPYNHQCSNGHCIPSLYNCSEDINACGDVDYNCDKAGDTDEVSVGFGNIIKYFLIVVACICIFMVLKSMAKGAKQKCRNLPSIEECCHRIRSKFANCCKTVNFSRLPKPRLPEFIRNRLRTNNQESVDDISNNDAVDNTAFVDDENEDDPVQVVISLPHATDLSQTDNEPPSYEEAMTSGAYSNPSLQPEEPAPLYEEVVSEHPVSSTDHSFEYSTSADDVTNESRNQNEANFNIDGQGLSSNAMIDQETTSILNLYLNDFAVELSDDYSTDTDWDSQSDSTVLSTEQVSGTQPVLAEDNTGYETTANGMQTVFNTDSDWDSESNSTVLSQENMSAGRTLNNRCDTDDGLNTDWDSKSDSSVSPWEQRTDRQLVDISDIWSIDNGCDADNVTNYCDTPSSQHVHRNRSSNNAIGVGREWNGLSSSYTANSLSNIDFGNALSESETGNSLSGSDLGNQLSGSGIGSDFITRPVIRSDETHMGSRVIDDHNDELPVSPPDYDEAVPPPYYYDYIANVGRYKQDSFDASET